MEADRRVWRTLLQLSNPRAAAGSAPAGSAADPNLSPAQWKQLFELARAHGVLGILLHNLGSPCAVNRDTWQTAEQLWHAKLAKSLLVRHYGPELVDGLVAAGIPAATFKGADFADHLYPALRPARHVRYRRVDSARVLECRRRCARKAWLRAGCRARDAFRGQRVWRRELAPALESKNRMRPSLESDQSPLSAPARIDRIRRPRLGNDWRICAAASRATPASRLVIAAAHAAITHQFDRLLLLCDLREACRHFAGEVELAKLRALVDRTGMRAATDVALAVTARVLNDPSAAELRHRLGTRAFTRLGAGLASEVLLLDRQSMSSRVRQRLLRELLKRAA